MVDSTGQRNDTSELAVGSPRRKRCKGQHGHLSLEQKQYAFRLRARGWRLVDIAREVGCTAAMVGLMVRDGRHLDAVPFGWEPKAGCLTFDGREQILVGIGRGESLSAIGRQLGRSPSTITREVANNGGRDEYSAWRAHQRARGQARRPKPCKLAKGRLLSEVARRLVQLWSPQEISARPSVDYPDDDEMRVSHETIYQSLFVQGRGELRRELARCLRSGRTSRRSQGRQERRGRLPGMVMISERPASADDRSVPGHWEGDLVLGEGGRSAVGTLVERTSRFVLLARLVAEQATADRDRRLAARLRYARFPHRRSIDDFDYEFQPSVDRKLVEDLAT
jgi:IS30 family transposase